MQVHPPAHQLGPCDRSPQSTGAHVSTPDPQKLHTLWDKENENSQEVVFITFLVYKQALVCKNGTVLSYFHTPFSVRPKATQEAPPDLSVYQLHSPFLANWQFLILVHDR